MAWHSWRKGVRTQKVARRTVRGRKSRGQSLQTLFNGCPWNSVPWPSKDCSVVHTRINGQLGRFLLACLKSHHPLFWGHATCISPAASPWAAQTLEAPTKALFVWEVEPSSHTRQRRSWFFLGLCASCPQCWTRVQWADLVFKPQKSKPTSSILYTVS